MPPSVPPVDEIVFRPRYPAKVRLAHAGSVVFALLGLLMLPITPEEPYLGLLTFTFFGGLAAVVYLRPREVRFGDAITIRRRVLSDKRIAYSDVTDIGLGRLKAGRHGLNWAQMENGEELDEAVWALVERRVIPEQQLEGKAFRSDLAGVYSAIIASVVIPVLGFLMWFGIIPTEWYTDLPGWARGFIVPFGIFLGLYFIIRYGWFRETAA